MVPLPKNLNLNKRRRQSREYYNHNMSPEYLAYLNSERWAQKKELVYERSGGFCERCGTTATVVHHKTYDRIFRENLNDLQHLCDDCHDIVHGKK